MMGHAHVIFVEGYLNMDTNTSPLLWTNCNDNIYSSNSTWANKITHSKIPDCLIPRYLEKELSS